MPRLLALAFVLSAAVATAAALRTTSTPTAAAGFVPWTLREGWRTDRVWYDGQAEKAVYDAVRPVYGTERRYAATVYTNKQLMDPGLGVKASGASGVEVFKHHASERIPTEAYDYDFSTAAFVRSADLGPFKLTVATQDDCGASFKQLVGEEAGLAWTSSVYFPGTGNAQGRLEEADVVFEDALSLVLRDFPFEAGLGSEERLRIATSQKSPRALPFELRTVTVRLAARETLELPLGSVDAFRLDVEGGTTRRSLWFAAEAAAPWLHVMVRAQEDTGVRHELRSLERTAYWERR